MGTAVGLNVETVAAESQSDSRAYTYSAHVGRIDREYARSSRWLRAVQFGLVTAVLTGIGHVVAGGSLSIIVVLVALGFTAWHRVSLGGRRLSWPQLLGVAGLAQAASHFLLWMGGHDHAPSSQSAQALPGGSMLVVHIALAFVMVLFIRASEARMLARLWLDSILTHLAGLLVLPSVAVPPYSPPASTEVPIRSRILDHAIGRRGPPVWSIADSLSPLR
jgi:hypothetical protein